MLAQRIAVWFRAQKPLVQGAIVFALIAAVVALTLSGVIEEAFFGLAFIFWLVFARRTGARRPRSRGRWIEQHQEDWMKAEQARRRELAGPDGAVPLTELVDPHPTLPVRNTPGGLETWVDLALDAREAVARRPRPAPLDLPAPTAAAAPPLPTAPSPRAAPQPSAAQPIVQTGRRWGRRPKRPGSIVE